MHQLYGYPYLIISYISIDNNLNEILRLFFKSKKKKKKSVGSHEREYWLV